MRETKECAECGGIYFRPEYVHKQSEWDGRKYCSVKCANEAQRRQRSELKDAVQALEGHLQPQLEETAQPITSRQPVLRDLRIVRVGPNPKLLVCEYYELAERRICTVLVRKTGKFVRGMRLQLAEPANEADFVRPWPYTGPPPRHRGRW